MDLLLDGARGDALAEPPGPPALVAAVRAAHAAGRTATNSRSPKRSRRREVARRYRLFALSGCRRAAGRLFRWKLGLVPAAAERHDQVDSGNEALLLGRQQGLFIGKRGRLRGHHGRKVLRSSLVFVEGDLDSLPRRDDRLRPGLRCSRANIGKRSESWSSTLLKGGQDGLAVGRDTRLVGGPGRLLTCAAISPPSEQGLRRRHAERPRSDWSRRKALTNGLPT